MIADGLFIVKKIKNGLTMQNKKYPQNVTMSTLLSILLISSSLIASEAPIIQPGVPGQKGMLISSEDASQIADSSFTQADVQFMKAMIPHHEQALVMSKMAPERTNNEEVLEIAGRIEKSQADEIEFMKSWLTERGAGITSSAQDKHNHHDHKHHNMGAIDHSKMKGMATKKQLSELQSAESTKFDQLFLKLMIAHHDGAVEMVRDLRKQPGSAYDSSLNEFASDVSNDQTVEIERMNKILVNLSDDPRATLAAGLFDAEQASKNMSLVTSLPKPDGFFDPSNAGGLKAPKADDELSEKEKKRMKSVASSSRSGRYPMLSFDNTDMAFDGNTLVVGNYHGFNIYNIEDGKNPTLISSVVCPGGQGDVSIVENLLIMSVEQSRGRLDCGREGITEDVSDERFRGIRIFDISDLAFPVQVGAVQTCRGSHTHSVVSGPSSDGKILVYNSGTSRIRDQEELETCFDSTPGDTRTSLFRIDVIEIPLDDPSKARIIDSPTVFADSETGSLAGLWRGGDHGDETQRTSRTDQCHDITIFPSLQIAAGACSGNGILFDISNPREPKRIHDVQDQGFAYWHSATFNNSGTKVLFTDEWGGGGRARCRAWDPITWGADAIYDIENQKLKPKSYYKMPAPQLETENCVAHNGSIIPVPGRDIFVQAWYQGGISIMDFTDSANPYEIAFFDRGPMLEDSLLSGGFWSTYFYKGFVYGTEMVRGLDVLELLPSEYLSVNEIEAAKLAFPKHGPKNIFNPQQQTEMTWPINSTLALAYLDQVKREGSIDSNNEKILRSSLIGLESRTSAENHKILSIIKEFSELGSSKFTHSSEKTSVLQNVLKELTSKA